MSTFKPRSYAEISAARREAILTGAAIIPKGACHMCAWERIPSRALWCSAQCCQDYEAERKELLGA